MTVQIQYPQGTDISSKVRVGSLTGLTTVADRGAVGQGQLIIDDAAGSLTVNPLTGIFVKEPQCSSTMTYYGYTTDRTVTRIPGEDELSVARRWTVSIMDVNAQMGIGAIYQNSAKRPAETDLQRIAWLLSSTNSHLFDTGYVATTGAVNMSAADYRGQYPVDILSDCASSSGRQFFGFYDEAAAKIALFYHASTDAVLSSTLRISNVPGDEDRVTTFAPSRDAQLYKDPANVYTEVDLRYAGGVVHAFTADTHDVNRAIIAPELNTTSRTVAQARAAQYLSQAQTETDTITVTIQLPVDKINLLIAGHRVQVRFAHLTGYTSFTYVRATKRIVSQDISAPGLYTVTLELSNPAIVRGTLGNDALNTVNPPSNTSPFVPGTSDYVSMLRADGATHIWPLSEATGPAVDVVAAENGTYNNLHSDMTRAVVGPGVIAGSGGVQVASAGSPASNVSIDDGGADLPGGNSARSFEFWVKFVTVFLGSATFQYGHGSSSYNMAWSADGTVTVAGDSGLSATLSVSATIGDGNYHVLTFTYDSTTFVQSVYFDGVFASSQAFAHALNTDVTTSPTGLIFQSPPETYVQSYSSAAPSKWTAAQIAAHALGDAGATSAGTGDPGPGQPITNEPSVTSTGSGQTTFTLSHAYAPGSLLVFVNGIYEHATETSASAGTYTLPFVPQKNDIIDVRYQAALV